MNDEREELGPYPQPKLEGKALATFRRATRGGKVDLAELRRSVWEEIYAMATSPLLSPRVRLKALALIAARTDHIAQPPEVDLGKEPTTVTIHVHAAAVAAAGDTNGHARALPDADGIRLRLSGA